MVPGDLLDYWESYSVSADDVESSVIDPLYNKRDGAIRYFLQDPGGKSF